MLFNFQVGSDFTKKDGEVKTYVEPLSTSTTDENAVLESSTDDKKNSDLEPAKVEFKVDESALPSSTIIIGEVKPVICTMPKYNVFQKVCREFFLNAWLIVP